MTAAPLKPPAPDTRLQVMIADDSAIVRGMLGQWIEDAPDLNLAGVAVNGAQVLKVALQTRPDLIVLAADLPQMNGLEVLPGLLRACPTLQVVMATNPTPQGGQAALKGLSLGAASIIAKPASSKKSAVDAYHRELLTKLRALGEAAANRATAAAKAAPPAPARSARPASSLSAPAGIGVLAIAASTGGPPALTQFLKALGPGWPTPILITQHMPSKFTGVLAEQLTKTSGLVVTEGVDGAPLVAGQAVLAPGDWHMRVELQDRRPVIRLDQGPEENFCRPAADPMFRSVAEHYGARALAVILTGMGKDGQAGAKAIADAGGLVFAQDEATSVVWGMPGAVVKAGLAHEIGAVEDLACLALKQARRRSR